MQILAYDQVLKKISEFDKKFSVNEVDPTMKEITRKRGDRCGPLAKPGLDWKI